MIVLIISILLIVVLVVSLWLYSKALKLIVFFNNDDTYRYTPNTTTTTTTTTSKRPYIHKPWLGKKGSLNLSIINTNEWLEYDDHTIRIMNLCHDEMIRSTSTFIIANGYEDRVLEASLELLDIVINHINNYTKGGYITKDNNIITNHITNKVYDISLKHPLIVIRLIIGEDVVIMMKNNDNIHVLAGCVIVFPDNWKIEEKIGLPLAAIHYPVNALNTSNETYKQFTNPSSSPVIRAMEYFFDKLYNDYKENKTIVIYNRFNWAFQNHDNLTNRFYDFWSLWGEYLRELMCHAFNSSTELYIRTLIREILTKISLTFNNYSKCHILLRTERQTLRYLPSSSSVAFLVRTQVTPLDEVVENREDAIGLIDALKIDVSSNDNSSKGEFRNEIIKLLSVKHNL
jgi:hypothetical protein